MDEQVLLEERVGRVTILTLNRPDVLNALDPELMRSLRLAAERLSADDSVGCVILTGAGRGFCSGGDMRASKAARASIESQGSLGDLDPVADNQRKADWIRRSAEAARLLCEMPKPTIAMINGACAGAGLSLAGACDLRFGAQSAKFISGFAAIGMPGDYGGTWFWTRILGTSKARELYLLSEKMTAEEAHAFELVNRVFPDAELRERTLEVAARMAALPASGYVLMKENLNAACVEELAPFLARESRNMVLGREALVAARKAATAGK